MFYKSSTYFLPSELKTESLELRVREIKALPATTCLSKVWALLIRALKSPINKNDELLSLDKNISKLEKPSNHLLQFKYTV